MYKINGLALGQAEPTQEPIINVWSALNSLCLTKLTPEQCRGLIGTNPLYLPPTCVKDDKGLKWWAFLGIGFAIGKFV